MKRLVGVAVSVAILWLVWRHIDVARIAAAMRAADPWWLAAGLGCVVPLTLATAWRFRILGRSSDGPAIGLGDATRLILSSSTLNLFLPSKMGDIAKAWVLGGRYGYDPGLALAIVVLEKMLDLASLLAWGVLALVWVGGRDPWYWLAAAVTGGLLALLVVLIAPVGLARTAMRLLGGILPGKAGETARSFADRWGGVVGWFWRDRRRAGGVILLSLAIWAGHLAQFWLFARALGSAIPLVDNMAFATLAILVGLAPFTMAGVGTRDAAILFFYHGWLTPGQAGVLGVLATMRYLMPAVAGLPFLRDYLPARRVAAT